MVIELFYFVSNLVRIWKDRFINYTTCIYYYNSSVSYLFILKKQLRSSWNNLKHEIIMLVILLIYLSDKI